MVAHRWLCGALLLATLACSGGVDRQMTFAGKMAQRGYWREAKFRWEKTLASRPNDPELLNNLAVANESLGDFAEALRLYKKALELAPQSHPIRQNYTRFAEFYSDYTGESTKEKKLDTKPDPRFDAKRPSSLPR